VAWKGAIRGEMEPRATFVENLGLEKHRMPKEGYSSVGDII